VDTLDWKLKKDGAWVENAMQQIKAREDCIILMHDIHATTVDHVEDLIRRIKRIPGHRFALY
jgi:peptidoglycan-N-acetylglucosamine deacetylase